MAITEKFLLSRANCKKAEDMEDLTLANLNISELDKTLFTKLANLKCLNVSGNNLRTLKGITLKQLVKLNCEGNMITDIQFLKNFPNLTELCITGNPLTQADRYIAASLLPKLKHLDGKSCISLQKADKDAEKRLLPLIISVWETQFSDQLYEGMSENEREDLQTQFIRQLRRSALVCHEVPDKYRRFKIESIGKDIFERAVQQLFGIRQSPRKCTPQKDIKSPLPKLESKNKYFTSPTKRKLFEMKVLPNKRKSSNTENCVSSVSDSNKTSDGFKTPTKRNRTLSLCSPGKTTSVSPKKERKCTISADYVPHYFLRCHSINNDPADTKTQVWKAAFEPDVISPDKTTNIVATCGGNIICLVDCRTGRVIKRYKHPDLTEEFFTLDWTVITLGVNKTTLLAAGGSNKEIHLLHPSQLVCYNSYKAHNKRVNCVLFHSVYPTWLFSGGADKKIHLWDIGIPTCSEYKGNIQKLLTLDPNMEVIQLNFSSVHSLLFAACDGGLLVWNIEKDLQKTSKNGSQFESDSVTVKNKERVLYDGLTILSTDRFAFKVSNLNQIRVCSMHGILKNKKNLDENRKFTFINKNIYQWSDCNVDYLSIGCYVNNKNGFGLLASGDDCGQIWLYSVDIQSREKSTHPNITQASSILPWPDLIEDSSDRYQVPNLNTKKISVNSVAFNWNGQYLVACTDKNLLCIWKKN